MFTSGEVAAAVVGDFGVPTIVAANPTLVYVTPDGAYANFNTINVTKNCANKELALRVHQLPYQRGASDKDW